MLTMISYLPKTNKPKVEGVRSTGFYQSKKWKRVRDWVRIRDKMTCKHCHHPIVGRSIVDHIKEVNIKNVDNWDIAYNPDNLQLLCQECHNIKTFTKEKTDNETLW